jgi:hypothetical protein
VLLIGASFGEVGLCRVFLGRGLRNTGSLKHVAFAVNPSVSNVLDDECGEQASNQDCPRSSLIFDALDAVVGKKELRMCKELHPVSFCLSNLSRSEELTCTMAVEMMTPVPNWRMATMRVPSMLTFVKRDVRIGTNTPMAPVTRITKSRPIRRGTS